MGLSSFNKLGSTAEVLAAFFFGSIVSGYFFIWAGIAGHPLAGAMTDNPNWFAIGINLGKVLLLQYLAFFIVIGTFLILNRTPDRKAMGLTLNSTSIVTLVVVGIAGWAIGDLINKLVFALDTQFDLGKSVPWREALLNAEPTLGWWFLMAVGSFVLVPILEELFWRGYVQSRLMTSFSPCVTIIMTALLFTFSHSQYHQWDSYHVSTIIGLFVSALTMGWMTYKTGSLLPAIVMHVGINFPIQGVGFLVCIAIMLTIITLNWSAIKKSLKETFHEFLPIRIHLIDLLFVIVAVGSMLSISQLPSISSYIAYGSLITGGTITIIGVIRKQTPQHNKQ